MATIRKHKLIDFLREISLHKTIQTNLKIFGLKGLFYPPPILVFKHVDLALKHGSVTFEGKPSLGMIQIGAHRENIYSNKYDHTVFNVSGRIVFHGKAHFYAGSRTIVLKDGVMSVGKDYEIGCNSSIITSKGISFGDNCMISWDVLIIDSDLHPIYKNAERINGAKEVVIGKDVWIGCRSSILKGVTIPDGVIIGAGSRITRSLEYVKSVFVDQTMINQNISWSRDLVYD